MTAPTIFTFDEQGMLKLAALVRDQARQIRNMRREFEKRETAALGREIFTAFTTTWPDKYPTYPDETTNPNTYVVKFDDWRFEEKPGKKSLTRRKWNGRYELARLDRGPYLPENTRVFLRHLNGRYLIVGVLPDWASECVTLSEYSEVTAIRQAAKMTADKCSSLGLLRENADDSHGALFIRKGPGDSLFWSGSAASSCPQWHTTPRVKTGLHVGTANSYPAWLRLGQGFPVYHLNPPSGGGQKIRWPTADPPGINSHLYIDAKQGKGLQTEWGYQGCDADVYIDAGTSCGTKTCVYFQVRKGIVTNIQGLSVNPPPGDHGTVVSTIHLDSPYDPCTPTGKGLYFLADVVFETLAGSQLSVL